MEQFIRFSPHCGRRSIPVQGESLQSHEDQTGIEHNYVPSKKIYNNCHKYHEKALTFVEPLKISSQKIELALNGLTSQIDMIKARMQEEANQQIEELLAPIANWQLKLDPDSKCSCQQVAQIADLTDPKKEEERSKELNQQLKQAIKRIQTLFSEVMQSIISKIQPFLVRASRVNELHQVVEQEMDLKAVVPEQISEIQQDSLCSQASFEQLSRIRESLIGAQQSRIHSRLQMHCEKDRRNDWKKEARQDQAMPKSKVREKDKRPPSQSCIAQLKHLHETKSLVDYHFRMTVRVVRILFFWVDDQGESKLQVIVGDETGVAPACLRYDTQIEKNKCLDLLSCRFFESQETIFITCDQFKVALNLVQSNQEGIKMGKIKKVYGQWSYLVPSQRCVLVRQIGYSLKDSRNIKLANMVVQVTAIIDEIKSGTLAMVADSSGVMWAVLKRTHGGKIQENDVLWLRNVYGVNGKIDSPLLQQEVAYIDGKVEGSFVESFPFPFWQTGGQMIEI